MEQWKERLAALEQERRQAMEFLRDHLPESDLDCYPFDLFLAFADQALSVRREAPWCAALDEEIFCHYVLFPRVNDEDLLPPGPLPRRPLAPGKGPPHAGGEGAGGEPLVP